MFSDLTSIRTGLRDRLGPHFPEEWRIVDHIAAPAESLVPVVYFEFTAISTEANGQPLGRDIVASEVDVVVTTPRTDEGGAEDDVDAHVLSLVKAVRTSDDIYWSTARKVQLGNNGPMAWRISLTLLTSTAPSEGD